MLIYLLFLRYLVENEWFVQWKRYTDFDLTHIQPTTKPHPGHVNNANLLKGLKIVPNIIVIIMVYYTL